MRMGVASRSPRYPMIPHISLLNYNSWGAYFDRYWDVGTVAEAVRLLLGAGAWRDVRVRRDRVLHSRDRHGARNAVGVANLDREGGVRGALAEVHRIQPDALDAAEQGRVAADDHGDGRDRDAGHAVAARGRVRRCGVDQRDGAAGGARRGLDVEVDGDHIHGGAGLGPARCEVDQAVAVGDLHGLVRRVDRAHVHLAWQRGGSGDVRLPADRPVEVNLARIRNARPGADRERLVHAPPGRGAGDHHDRQLADLARVDLDRDGWRLLDRHAAEEWSGSHIQADRGAGQRARRVDRGDQVARVDAADHVGQARVRDGGFGGRIDQDDVRRNGVVQAHRQALGRRRVLGE